MGNLNNDVYYHKKDIFEYLLTDRIFIERYLRMASLEDLIRLKKIIRIYIKKAKWERIRYRYLNVHNIAQNKSFAQNGVGTYMATRLTPAMALSLMPVRLLVAVCYYLFILVLIK